MAVSLLLTHAAWTSWSLAVAIPATTAWVPRCVRARAACASLSSCRLRPISARQATPGRSGPTLRRPITASRRLSLRWVARCVPGPWIHSRCCWTRRVRLRVCAWSIWTGRRESPSASRAPSTRCRRSWCSSLAALRVRNTACSKLSACPLPRRAARCP